MRHRDVYQQGSDDSDQLAVRARTGQLTLCTGNNNYQFTDKSKVHTFVTLIAVLVEK